ncbi:MAG TPA: YwbE family protein [Anaerolineae bacterium]|nr:YwbE family protein [Anaerolineae bacterium]
MSLPQRSDLKPGMRVQIIEKHNQRSGAVTEGVVARLLTSSPAHPYGIKVQLTDGRVGRVKAILPAEA